MVDPTAATAESPDQGKSFFGHPRGLVTCFMVEFFERFTYYGMRSMLVLFLGAAATAANPGFGIDGATAGAVYEGQPGARRDAGFSIFYMGINLGATIGPLTASALGEKVNWHLGFLVCGIATLLGTLYFLWTQRYLGTAGLP